MADDAAENGNGAAPTITAESDWRGFAPADVQGDLKALESVKDIGTLIKTAIHSQKALGSAIRLPGKDAKPEDVAKAKTDIMAKIRGAGLIDGAPESPDKYQYQRPEGALDRGWNEAQEKEFLKVAHAEGFTNAQVQAIIKWYGDFHGGQVQAAVNEAQALAGELRREWGPNFDANLGRANRAITEFGGEPLVDLFDKSGMGRHPLVVKAFANIGNALVEHGAMTGSSTTSGMGPSDAQARMDEIWADANHPYNNRTHPDHAKALDEYLALSKIVDGRR